MVMLELSKDECLMLRALIHRAVMAGGLQVAEAAVLLDKNRIVD